MPTGIVYVCLSLAGSVLLAWSVRSSIGLRMAASYGLSVLALLTACLVASMVMEHRLAQRITPAQHATVTPFQGHVVDLPEIGMRRARFGLKLSDGRLLRTSWYEPERNIRPGDCLEGHLKLRAPRGSANAGTFDYEAWLLRSGHAGSATIRAAASCTTRLDSGLQIDRLRAWIAARVTALLPAGIGQALIPALTVGDRRGLDDAEWEVLRATGTSHLVAISGLHIGLFAAFGYWLGAWLWRRSARLCRAFAAPKAGWVLGGVFALGFAALAGFSLPAQRALVMVLVFVMAGLAGRLSRPYSALSIAALLVLALDPLAPLAPGFWLSFSAVGWIIWLTHRRVGDGVRTKSGKFWLAVRLQLALSLGLAPVTALLFGSVSLSGPLANIVLIPLLAIAMPLILLLTLLAAVLPWLAAYPLELLAWLLDIVWGALAGLANATSGDYSQSLGLIAAACWVVGCVLLSLPRGAVWPWRIGGAVALVLVMTVPSAWRGKPPPGVIWVDVLDVGQGLSVLVRTREHALLYDAGPAYRGGFDAGAAIVVPALRELGVGRLDRLVVSHGDNDHAGGVSAVTAALAPHGVLGAGGARCRAGQQWQWDGAEFEVLHPAASMADGNNASCVLRVAYPGGPALLLPGDIEASAEMALTDVLTPAALVLMPHHGSRSSSTPGFVAATQPEFAIAAAGWRNRWGFPHDDVVQRWQAEGARVLTTGDHGQLRFALHRNHGVELLYAHRWDQPRRWRSQSKLAP